MNNTKAFLLKVIKVDRKQMKPQLPCESADEPVSSCPAQELETTCSKVINEELKQQCTQF